MARAAEFRAIEEALTGALKFFDTRPSAQDTQRFVALCAANTRIKPCKRVQSPFKTNQAAGEVAGLPE